MPPFLNSVSCVDCLRPQVAPFCPIVFDRRSPGAQRPILRAQRRTEFSNHTYFHFSLRTYTPIFTPIFTLNLAPSFLFSHLFHTKIHLNPPFFTQIHPIFLLLQAHHNFLLQPILLSFITRSCTTPTYSTFHTPTHSSFIIQPILLLNSNNIFFKGIDRQRTILSLVHKCITPVYISIIKIYGRNSPNFRATREYN